MMIIPILLASASIPVVTCDLGSITSLGELDRALSNRAVEMMIIATQEDRESAKKLTSLVDNEVPFSLGASDVGRPLGNGPVGARKMAELMSADRYRFFEWGTPPPPYNPCSERAVTVEFIDTAGSYSSTVKFTFNKGRLISAEGWQRPFRTGSLPKVASKRPSV